MIENVYSVFEVVQEPSGENSAVHLIRPLVSDLSRNQAADVVRTLAEKTIGKKFFAAPKYVAISTRNLLASSVAFSPGDWPEHLASEDSCWFET